MTLYEMIEAVREAYWKKERQAYSVLFDEAKRAAFDVPVARFFKKQRYVLICCEVAMEAASDLAEKMYAEMSAEGAADEEIEGAQSAEEFVIENIRSGRLEGMLNERWENCHRRSYGLRSGRMNTRLESISLLKEVDDELFERLFRDDADRF